MAGWARGSQAQIDVLSQHTHVPSPGGRMVGLEGYEVFSGQ